uniref:Uncharacterized protein n=1 Tax=Glossina pallidipes TaxID=7398 RepID=A0A1A9Z933_GLOPL
MKVIIVLAVLFAVASARPDVETVRQDSFVQPDGFKFGVETSDGSKHDAEGQLKALDKDHVGIAVHGSYQFVDKDGHAYVVNYVADENGYRAQDLYEICGIIEDEMDSKLVLKQTYLLRPSPTRVKSRDFMAKYDDLE